MLYQGRIKSIRGATLICGENSSTLLSRIPTYPSQLTYASRHGVLSLAPLTMPSAVHLTICILFGSHLPELSVSAYIAVISASTV